MSNNYTSRLAEFVSQTTYEELPADVIHATKRLILDTLGNAVAGHATSGAKRVLKTVSALGGIPECTTFVTGHKTSPAYAVLANVALATTLEADDTCLYLGHHGQSSILPALALSEQRGASGKSFLAASALAYEAGGRIASACRHLVRKPDGELLANPSGGGVSWVVFCAAFSAGRILGLDAGEMAHAMGVAGMNATIPTGTRWPRPPYNNSKYNPYAFLAHSGTLAALLAQNGFTSDNTILDADPDTGLSDWWAMSGNIGSDPAKALATLGQSWLTTEASFKPYPVCRFIQGPLGLFEKLIAEHSLTPEDIENIEVYADHMIFHYKMESPHVSTEEDAQFSVPHAFAMAANRIPPGPLWVAPRYWQDNAVAAFKAKVSCKLYDKSVEATTRQLLDGRWEKYPHKIIVQVRGETFTREADYVNGDPFTPETAASDEQLIQKFRTFTEQRLATDQIDRCIETVMSLDKLDDVAPLIDCLN